MLTPVIITTEQVPVADFEAGTGWHLRPEGACRGDLCVPMPAGVVEGDTIDVTAAAERLRMPVVRDETRGVSAIGPAVLGGHRLETAIAPDLVLPDVEGRPFDLASLHGQKVVLVAWAPY